MGTNYFYYEVLPAPDSVTPVNKRGQGHQLEIFRHGGKVYIRMGPLGERNGGLDQYTGTLSNEEIQRLKNALDNILSYAI